VAEGATKIEVRTGAGGRSGRASGNQGSGLDDE
jgi:hypothetical protein